MSLSPPRCYNFTFSTYGTRLLGDKRGTTRWDGTRIPRNDPLKKYMEENLKERSFDLSFDERAVVHDAIFTSAVKHKLYIDALNVRSAHIHLLVCSLEGLTGMQTIRFIKNDVRRALTQILNREQIERIWTKSYALTEILEIGNWRRVVDYVLMQQGANDYMAQTKFAALTGLTNPNNRRELYAAFKVKKNSFYRLKLFAQLNVVRIENESSDNAPVK